MKKFMKAIVAVILMTIVVFATGCKPEDDPDNGGGNIYTIEVLANPSDFGDVIGDGSYIQGDSCTLIATANDGYVFYYWSENNEWVSSDATYSFSVDSDRDIVAHFAISSGDGHAYIDLGLPSGTLWATCNVGANAPEEYGDHFAWGETDPKTTYNWSTYKWCNGNWNQLTKYCQDAYAGYNDFTDNLTTLLPEDDAATANWGDGWRMPTKEECRELINNTTSTWTTHNGVEGRLFTAANGRSLFLSPAGGRWDEDFGTPGSYGGYWSSSLCTDAPTGAWNFYFYSFECDIKGPLSRPSGQSVRAVRSAPQN